jgi:hypothetical protein
VSGAGFCRCLLIVEQIGAYGRCCSSWFYSCGFAAWFSVLHGCQVIFNGLLKDVLLLQQQHQAAQYSGIS